MARPRKGQELGRTEIMTLRLTPELRARIKAVAVKARLPESEVIHRTLEIFLSPGKPDFEQHHDLVKIQAPAFARLRQAFEDAQQSAGAIAEHMARMADLEKFRDKADADRTAEIEEARDRAERIIKSDKHQNKTRERPDDQSDG